MHTTCPFCKQTYEVEDQYLGQQIECQKCKHEFTIAQSQEPPQKTAAPQEPEPKYSKRRFSPVFSMSSADSASPEPSSALQAR